MINTEIVKANSVLAGLTDEQCEAIITLSNNSEKAEIEKLNASFESTIATGFDGYKRNDGEDNTAFISRVVGSLKTDASKNAEKVETLTKEVAKLNKTIADNAGDAELTKKLTTAQKDLAAITQSYADLKKQSEADKAEYSKKILDYKIDTEINAARSNIKYSDTISESARDALTRQAIEKIKSFAPSFTDDGKLIFHNADGSTMVNKENGLNPFSASELLMSELRTFGILNENPNNGGAGTKNPAPKIITGYKTQAEAIDAYGKELAKDGYVAGTKAHSDKMAEFMKANDISKLPER